MTDRRHHDCAAAADVAFRRRALAVNSGIYARRHAPSFMPTLAGAGGLRARYAAVSDLLGSERDWGPDDAARLADLAGEIARLGRRCPDAAETCAWHADRLRELVRQHAALAELEAKRRPHPTWPAARDQPKARARRRATAEATSPGLRA